MANSSLDDLQTAIASGKALVVCGSGVSTAASSGQAPGWKRLIETAIDAAPKEASEDWSAHCKASLTSADPDVWLSAADIVQKKLGGFEGPLYRAWLKDTVGKLKLGIGNSGFA